MRKNYKKVIEELIWTLYVKTYWLKLSEYSQIPIDKLQGLEVGLRTAEVISEKHMSKCGDCNE